MVRRKTVLSFFLLTFSAVFSGVAAPLRAGEAIQWQHDWARGAVFYEVFVRSFADSDGDGIGDLAGLTARLDYLNDGDPATTADLGVDALWLMPVFASPSYHGYDVVDYEAIEPDYGTAADFDRLLAEAHKRGLRIIVDFVMNHTSSQHPWFVASSSPPPGPYRAWYVWRSDNPGWTQPWGGTNPVWHEKNGAYFYGIFWSGMPDLNFATEAVREEVKRLAAHWLARGVDGFRLDATRHLFANGPGEAQNDQPETHLFLEELSAHVRKVAPAAVLVGENWTETPIIARYFGSTAEVKWGDELPMNFNFPVASAIVEGVKGGDASGIAAKLAQVQALYPAGVNDAPFLTNHDMPRVATQLLGDPERLESAAAILLTLPGAPFLYYGEEVGLLNGPGREDQHKRTPMPWDGSPGGGFTTGKPWFDFAPGKETANVAAQTADPESLLSCYRQLIRVRRASKALRLGSLQLLEDGAAPVLVYLRAHGRERVLVAHNLGDAASEIGPLELRGRRAEPLFVSPGTPKPRRTRTGWTVRLPAGATGIWRLQ